MRSNNREVLWYATGILAAVLPSIIGLVMIEITFGFHHRATPIIGVILLICAAMSGYIVTKKDVLRRFYEWEGEILLELFPPLGGIIWVMILMASIAVTVLLARWFAFDPTQMFSGGPLVAIIIMIIGQPVLRWMLTGLLLYGGAAIYLIRGNGLEDVSRGIEG